MSKCPEAVAWATARGADETDVRRAWRLGQTADVPIGTRDEVVRAGSAAAFSAIHRLQSDGCLLGPILDVQRQGVIEFFVPRGTARSWPMALLDMVCVERGALPCPAPRFVIGSGLSAGGRSWVVPPVRVAQVLTPAPAPWTDDDALCEALAAAIVHSVGPYIPKQARRRTI